MGGTQRPTLWMMPWIKTLFFKKYAAQARLIDLTGCPSYIDDPNLSNSQTCGGGGSAWDRNHLQEVLCWLAHSKSKNYECSRLPQYSWLGYHPWVPQQVLNLLLPCILHVCVSTEKFLQSTTQIVASGRTCQLYNLGTLPLMEESSKDFGSQKWVGRNSTIDCTQDQCSLQQSHYHVLVLLIVVAFLDQLWRQQKSIKNVDSNHFQDIGIVKWLELFSINMPLFPHTVNNCIDVGIRSPVGNCKLWYPVHLHICSLSILQVIRWCHQK